MAFLTFLKYGDMGNMEHRYLEGFGGSTITYYKNNKVISPLRIIQLHFIGVCRCILIALYRLNYRVSIIYTDVNILYLVHYNGNEKGYLNEETCL